MIRALHQNQIHDPGRGSFVPLNAIKVQSKRFRGRRVYTVHEGQKNEISFINLDESTER